jgi:hypothetical protein
MSTFAICNGRFHVDSGHFWRSASRRLSEVLAAASTCVLGLPRYPCDWLAWTIWM